MSNDKPDELELTQDELAALVNGIDAAYLVDYLKYAGDQSLRVLQGFRLNRQAVKSPAVEQRLVNEALRDGFLRDTLTILWRDSIPREIAERIDGLTARDIPQQLSGLAGEFGGERIWLSLLVNERKNVRKLAAKWKERLLAIPEPQPESPPPPPEPGPNPAPDANQNEKLRRLREERAALLDEIRRIKPQLAEAATLVEKSKAGTRALDKQLVQATRQNETLTRKLQKEEQARKKAESELAALRRSVKSLSKTETKTDVKRRESETLPKSEVWPDVVARMLNNRLYSEAIAFCEELVKRHPDELRAHELLYRAYSETRRNDLALTECWWLSERLITKGDLQAAAYMSCSAVGLDPQSARTAKILDKLLKKLDLSDKAVTQEVRTAFRRYRSRYPEQYKLVSAAIARAGREYQRALEGESQVGFDTLFTFEHSGRRELLSARDLVSAVNSNMTTTVDFVRHALRAMKTVNPAAYRNIINALESRDGGCMDVLLRKTSPIVVDGSNVAFACTTGSGKPRLNNILLLRNALHSQGHFPVYIYADANLRYRIDQGGTMEQMINAQEIICVDSYTDADETILLEARRRNCPVVTNDRMLEWDPDNQVEKIRFDADQRSVELRPEWG